MRLIGFAFLVMRILRANRTNMRDLSVCPQIRKLFFMRRISARPGKCVGIKKSRKCAGFFNQKKLLFLFCNRLFSSWFFCNRLFNGGFFHSWLFGGWFFCNRLFSNSFFRNRLFSGGSFYNCRSRWFFCNFFRNRFFGGWFLCNSFFCNRLFSGWLFSNSFFRSWFLCGWFLCGYFLSGRFFCSWFCSWFQECECHSSLLSCFSVEQSFLFLLHIVSERKKLVKKKSEFVRTIL